MSAFLSGLREELERLKTAHRHRQLALPRGLDFASNDYLALSRHRALSDAVAGSLEEDGVVGAGASRLLRGHHPAHARLEDFAAGFFGSEKTLFFASGFAANFALFGTLAERHDAVVFDERIHASVHEGLHASQAQRLRARHNDLDSFEEAIRRARERGTRRLFVAVESVYSMDGDFAPLPELDALARRYEAVLVVDEAHATGIFGARGRGLGEALHNDNWISLHTGGKALGASGALVCGAATIIDYLVNKARVFIYSTAPPPMLAACLERALKLIDEEPWRRRVLLERASFAHAQLAGGTGFAGSQIIPIVLGDEERSLAVARALQEAGFDVRAVRPPTVPDGTSRLRVSIHADHSEADILGLAACLRSAMHP